MVTNDNEDEDGENNFKCPISMKMTIMTMKMKTMKIM